MCGSIDILISKIIIQTTKEKTTLKYKKRIKQYDTLNCLSGIDLYSLFKYVKIKNIHNCKKIHKYMLYIKFLYRL